MAEKAESSPRGNAEVGGGGDSAPPQKRGPRRCNSAWRSPKRSPSKSRRRFALPNSPGLSSLSFPCSARGSHYAREKRTSLNLRLSGIREAQASRLKRPLLRAGPQLFPPREKTYSVVHDCNAA